jgi:N-acetyl-1-D-myo-inositol-2-amino-2-deoxy-alpha-D-glucopyranoside deacetylase
LSAPTILAIFAHPDDEAFGTGGTLSKYAAAGCDVFLVTATRGEAGNIAEPDLATSANLPAVREQELSCACDAYGIHPPIFLDYVDGQLPMVHQGQAVGKLVKIIRDLKPQIVITFDAHGIYGHYDHIAVHRWASIAVDLAADPDCFPDQVSGTCQPHQVDKLYYRVLPKQQLKVMSNGESRAAVIMDGVPFYFVGLPSEEITTVIDVADHLAAKLDGIRCHVTQVGRESRFSQTPDEVIGEPWFRTEHFVLAHSTVGMPEGVETDLLRGLR